jgi:hypothetical protein
VDESITFLCIWASYLLEKGATLQVRFIILTGFTLKISLSILAFGKVIIIFLAKIRTFRIDNIYSDVVI